MSIDIAVHTAIERVRYADTDKMGIVYNGNYLRYFEIGRTEMLRAHGLPYAELEKEGYLLPVLEAHVIYKQPARYDDVLEIHTTYHAHRSPSLRIEYEIRSNNVILVTGFTKHSFVSAETFKPIRPPAFFFEQLQRHIQGTT